MMTKDTRPTLLLVDDEPTNLQVLRHTLQDQYRLLFAKDGHKALNVARQNMPDLILLDVMMPEMSGYEVCRRLKQDNTLRRIPIIFVTALSESEDERQGLELGAVDFITKPFSPAIVKARIRTQLSLVQADEVLETRLKIIESLGTAAEYRDNETGRHIIRISHFSRRVALEAGYDEPAAEQLRHASPMHDVGKIGIPDAILLKPGKLDPDEWAIMKQHTVIGARIIGDHEASLLKLAADIALRHHERWDGSGYPDGIAGSEIPHEARIVAIVDVFDALTSERPYKKAWPVDKALALIRSERGRHFDPDIADAFMSCIPDILSIREQWLD